MGAKSTETPVVRRAPVIGSPDDARERILQGAIRSIARHGLERTSIASIAREAGTRAKPSTPTSATVKT